MHQQQQAINILTRHYGEFHCGLIFTLEIILSGLARDDIGAIELGLEDLESETKLLKIKPMTLADIVRVH